MFPQLRERVGSALDLVVEFSTLGEYRLGADGALWPASALTPAPERDPQLGGAGDPYAARAAVRRTVAGGAAGPAPVATPAARRLARKAAVRQRAGAAHAATASRGVRPPHAGAASGGLRPPHAGAASGGVRPPHAGAASACQGERRRGGSERTPRRDTSRPGTASRPGAPAAAEQLCFAL
jgi:hypothetical protein